MGTRPQVPLELYEAPDLRPVDPQVGFDEGGRRLDGGEVDAELLGGLLQRGGDRAGQGGVVGVPGGHARQPRRTSVRRTAG